VTRRPTTWTASSGATGSWQSTPRAAHQPSPSGLGLAVILLCWFSPLSLAVWLVGQLLILVQKRWHWHRFALAALAYLVYVLAVIGPEQALRRHFYVHTHFWQYVALLLGFGPPGATLSIGQLAHDVVMTQLWLGVPVGLLAAALAVYFAEHAAGNAEWSPLVRRRQLVDQRARDRKTAKLLAKPRDHKLSMPALGIALDGDLPSWVQAATSSHPYTCAARRWRSSVRLVPARPSPPCAWPTSPGCWAARSASPTARAPTPPWSPP
jgi:hypothetical protein